jgi:hypothetical protein
LFEIIHILRNRLSLEGLASQETSKSQAETDVAKEEDWFDGFQRKADPRLREIFEKDLDHLPKRLFEKLEELRVAELKLLARTRHDKSVPK